MLSDLVVTDKVVNLFKQNNIKGFNKKHTIRNSVFQNKIKFWEMEIIGQGGFNHERSKIYLKYSCEYCGYKRYSAYDKGIIIDENNWDGSDIFATIEYPKFIIVTENLKNIIELNKLTNIDFIETKKLRWTDSVIRP